MSATIESLSHDALVLPPAERMTLAYRLLLSVEPGENIGADEAWQEEISNRIARYDAGAAETVPAAEVFARLREIAPGQ